MRRAVLGVLAGLSIAAGCSNDPGFHPTVGVRAAEPGEVLACRYVSDLKITPNIFGPLAEEGLKYSRNKIMSDAAGLGANTVVFQKVEPGTTVTEVRATAYSC